MVDNRWIVLYNLHLATKYHVHINVGPDRAIAIVERWADMLGQENNAQAVVANGEWQNQNEIKAYLEGCYVSAFKASWCLFSFRMHDGTASVTCLTVHEPGMHTIVYNDNASIFEF